MKKTTRKKADRSCVVAYCAVVVILLLTALNLGNFLSSKSVLGVATLSKQDQPSSFDKDYWERFLSDNPEYVPGWIEIGRFDKAEKISPNYFTGKSAQTYP
jgi:hypothetical protein